jgi:hypothetical protein
MRDNLEKERYTKERREQLMQRDIWTEIEKDIEKRDKLKDGEIDRQNRKTYRKRERAFVLLTR